MFRTLIIVMFTATTAGCISTPNTKALITPIGAVGVHSFAPPSDPNRMTPSRADALARVASHQRTCNDDGACLQHE
jgi:hypothetical protein